MVGDVAAGRLEKCKEAGRVTEQLVAVAGKGHRERDDVGVDPYQYAKQGHDEQGLQDDD